MDTTNALTGPWRKEVLKAEWFLTAKHAQLAINAWIKQYNQIRPHHALAMRPPAPETLLEKLKLAVLRNGARQDMEDTAVKHH